MSTPGPISNFIEHHYRHFNAAALKDAAHSYTAHLLSLIHISEPTRPY